MSKSILVYDLCLLPDGMTIEEVIEKLENENVLVYDTRINFGRATPYLTGIMWDERSSIVETVE